MTIGKNNFKSIIGIIFVELLVILIPLKFSKNNHLAYAEKEKLTKAYDRGLFVLFYEELDTINLYDILNDITDYVEVKRHIGDYALISVKEKGKYEDIESYLSNHPSVKIVQQDGSIQLMQASNVTYSKTQWAIHNPGY